MSEFKLQFSLGTDSLCNGCPALHWRASDACYLCGVEKRRVHSGIAIDGINRTDWCPLQKASDAEAALKEKDARIKELTETNNRLQDAILKDSCPWCGLNNKSNVKREMEARG